MSEFYRYRLVGYRDSGLPFRDIASRTGEHPFTVMQILNQWFAEDHTAWNVGSQRNLTCNARDCEVKPAKTYNLIKDH